MNYLAAIRGTHHVPEMGAEGSCSLVVLHHTVIVEDVSTAFTVAEIKTTFTLFQSDDGLYLNSFWTSLFILT